VTSIKVPLAELPWPSTESTAGVVLRQVGGALSLTFQAAGDGARQRVEISFGGVRAHAHRSEGVSTAWHVTDSYDTLVEVSGSAWLEEIEGLDRQRGHLREPLHHFMIYVDSDGAYEVIARDWQLRMLD
jgi:hypothetical protein